MIAHVHEAAARGFDAAADAYERGRPGYPPEAVAVVVDALAVPGGARVLDLAAGTGKLTRLLAPAGVELLALEPVAAMRSKLVHAVPGVQIVKGTAEDIGLDAAAVDAVVVAQAFHWFDAVRALSEIHRVLRPGGRLAVVWNERDESVPWVARMGERIRALADDVPAVRDEDWRAAIARSGLFGPFTEGTFRHAQRLGRAGLDDRVASISYVAAAEPSARARVIADVRAIVDGDPTTRGPDDIDLPYVTHVRWAERRTIAPGDAGLVASVNVSNGGVPKAAVDRAEIARSGLRGDAHAEPEPMHGGPDQALCLYAQEAIERVRADGHQAFPGAYGENITLLGLNWGALRPGDRVAFGDDGAGAVLELTKQASPCQTIAHWFVDRRIARISGRVVPEDARWYARVLREGLVRPGMPVGRLGPTGAFDERRAHRVSGD